MRSDLLEQTTGFTEDFTEDEDEDEDETPDDEPIDIPVGDPPTLQPTPEQQVLTAPRRRRRFEPLSFPKTRPSAVDLHPKRGEIERAMLKGQLSLSQLGKKYKLSPSSIQRHRRRLLAQLEQADQIRTQYREDRRKKLETEVDEIHGELVGAVKEAKLDRKWAGVAQVAGAALNSRKLAAELAGVLGGDGGHGGGPAIPGIGSLANITAENLQLIIATPKKRKDRPERVVDITPQQG